VIRFHPAGAPVPDGTRSDRLLLRPLRATDVDADYDAVMSSRAMLRNWSQTTWPADDFTREENLRDLGRHEREHREGVAFTYTVLDPAASRCLGCVYLTPLPAALADSCEHGTHGTRLGFWVRASEVANDLDRHLLGVLRIWLASEWAFDTTLFSVSPQEIRQASLLAEAGLMLRAEVTLPDGQAIGSLGRAGNRPDSGYRTPPRVRRHAAIVSAPRSTHDHDHRGLKNVPSILNLLPFA
jgi:hypothetical protein